MGQWLVKVAIWTAAIATAIGAVFGVLIWFGGPGILAAVIGVALFGAVATAWIAEAMYRKSFPNLFRKFEKEQQNRTFVGDGNE
jgi:hypothetical protein